MTVTDTKFIVTTTDGAIANQGGDKTPGMPEGMALADARVRNERAENLGIQTRYEVRPL